MRKAALRIWTLCFLTLVWILLWGTFSVGNIVGGLVVALVIHTAAAAAPGAGRGQRYVRWPCCA